MSGETPTQNLIDEIVKLREVKGLSWRQIGAKLEIPKSTAHHIYTTRPAKAPSAALDVTTRKFMVGVLDGKEPVKAAVEAGVPKDKANAFLRTLDNDSNFQTAMSRAADRRGITVNYVMGRLRRLLNAKRRVVIQFRGQVTETVDVPDNQARLGAVREALKIHGIGDPRRDEVETPRRVELTLTPKRVEWVNEISGVPVEEIMKRAEELESGRDQKRDGTGRFADSAPTLEEKLPDEEIEWEEEGSVAANLSESEDDQEMG